MKMCIKSVIYKKINNVIITSLISILQNAKVYLLRIHITGILIYKKRERKITYTLSSAEAPSVEKRREIGEKDRKRRENGKIRGRGDDGNGKKFTSFPLPSQHPPLANFFSPASTRLNIKGKLKLTERITQSN